MRTVLEIREFLDNYYKNGVPVKNIHIIDYVPLYDINLAKRITETGKEMINMLDFLPEWMTIKNTYSGKRIFCENDPYGEENW